MQLRKHNIKMWGYLYREGTFLQLDQYLGEADSTSLDPFTYYRERGEVREATPDFPSEPPALAALDTVLKATRTKHLITRLYAVAQGERRETVLGVHTIWEAELGQDITKREWVFCCTQTKMLSPSSRLRIIHLKFLQLSYITPNLLAQCGLREDDCCNRCRRPRMDFLHLPWACPTEN